jgi:hypothetical protein
MLITLHMTKHRIGDALNNVGHGHSRYAGYLVSLSELPNIFCVKSFTNNNLIKIIISRI